jgi:hypothetical protein
MNCEKGKYMIMFSNQILLILPLSPGCNAANGDSNMLVHSFLLYMEEEPIRTVEAV